MSESRSLIGKEPEQPEEPSVSKVIENVNKNITLLEHGDIRRPLRRNAAPCTATGCKWPKSRYYVYVPVSISSAYTTTQGNIIINALLSFHDSTCIRFHWRDRETSYLNFISDYGCWSYVGRQGGRQDVSLQARGCLYHEVVQHEVLHALGFHHEQVRSDRDDYIRILTENIIPPLPRCTRAFLPQSRKTCLQEENPWLFGDLFCFSTADGKLCRCVFNTRSSKR